MVEKENEPQKEENKVLDDASTHEVNKVEIDEEEKTQAPESLKETYKESITLTQEEENVSDILEHGAIYQGKDDRKGIVKTITEQSESLEDIENYEIDPRIASAYTEQPKKSDSDFEEERDSDSLRIVEDNSSESVEEDEYSLHIVEEDQDSLHIIEDGRCSSEHSEEYNKFEMEEESIENSTTFEDERNPLEIVEAMFASSSLSSIDQPSEMQGKN